MERLKEIYTETLHSLKVSDTHKLAIHQYTHKLEERLKIADTLHLQASEKIEELRQESQDLIMQIEQIEDSVKNGEYCSVGKLGNDILAILGRE